MSYKNLLTAMAAEYLRIKTDEINALRNRKDKLHDLVDFIENNNDTGVDLSDTLSTLRDNIERVDDIDRLDELYYDLKRAAGI